LSSLYASGSTSRSVTHPKIAPGQACLTLEFFADGLPEKKLQLSGISMLLILLSRGDVTDFMCIACATRKLIIRPSPLKIKVKPLKFLKRIQGDIYRPIKALL
jgi:hypothetical protein